MLYQSAEALTDLAEPVGFTCLLLEGELQGEEAFNGSFVKLSRRRGEARLEKSVSVLSNLKIRLQKVDGEESSGVLYGKVVSTGSGGKTDVVVYFTSMSREAETFLSTRYQLSTGDELAIPETATLSTMAPEQTTLH
jgi:hypothetical protein